MSQPAIRHQPLACAGPEASLPSQVGVGPPHLSVDTVARAPSRRSLDPVDFLQTSLASERLVSPTACLFAEALSVVDETLSRLTDSRLPPAPGPGPLWSQKEVISLREDFLGALPIFHTKSPGCIFHGRHSQIGAAARIRGSVGEGH